MADLENKFMRLALNEAQKAIEEGEMPVGAVIVRDGQVIATGHNVRNVTHDPTLHAEIVAIRKACEKLGDWRLSDCDLYVTLEPCVMCSGAIINSRMRSVYFGAYDAEYGGAGGDDWVNPFRLRRHEASDLADDNRHVGAGFLADASDHLGEEHPVALLLHLERVRLALMPENADKLPVR